MTEVNGKKEMVALVLDYQADPNLETRMALRHRMERWHERTRILWACWYLAEQTRKSRTTPEEHPLIFVKAEGVGEQELVCIISGDVPRE